MYRTSHEIIISFRRYCNLPLGTAPYATVIQAAACRMTYTMEKKNQCKNAL